MAKKKDKVAAAADSDGSGSADGNKRNSKSKSKKSTKSKSKSKKDKGKSKKGKSKGKAKSKQKSKGKKKARGGIVVAFLSLIGVGHVNPAIPLLQTLVQHKEVSAVHVWTNPFHEGKIDKIGAETHYYDADKGDDFSVGNFGPDGLSFEQALVGSAPYILDLILDDVRAIEPDVVMFDAFLAAGWCVGEILGVPKVTFVPGALHVVDSNWGDASDSGSGSTNGSSSGQASATGSSASASSAASSSSATSATTSSSSAVSISPGDAFVRESADRVRREHGIELPVDDAWNHFSELNVVPAVEEWHSPANRAAAAALDGEVIFMGPGIELRHDTPGDESFDFERLDAAHTVVYISMGSVVDLDDSLVLSLRRAFDREWVEHRRRHPPAGLGHSSVSSSSSSLSGSMASTDGDNDDDQRVVVVFAAGRSFDLEAHVEEHGPFPPWFVVKRWIPQLGVLRRASVFFSHCGLSSVIESAVNGVPIVANPHFGDQPRNASKVTDQFHGGVNLEDNSDFQSSGDTEKEAMAVRAAVDAVLEDASYRTGMGELQALIRAHDGATAAAADAIVANALAGRATRGSKAGKSSKQKSKGKKKKGKAKGER